MSKKVGIVGDVHLMETTPRSWKADYPTVILQELGTVLGMTDVTICLGDLFHTPRVSDEFKLRLSRMIAKTGKKLYTIWGNHDLFNLNLEGADKTSLALLAEYGVLEVRTSGWEIEGVWFDVLLPKQRPQVPVVSRRPSILLGHHFFEYSLDPDYSVTAKQLADSGYDVVLLGHDHEPHPPKKFGNTTLIRPGSLCRNTSHTYNLNRTPKIVVFELDSGRIAGASLEEVRTLAGTEVFRDDVFMATDQPDSPFMSNMESLLAQFTFVNGARSVYTVAKALQEVKAPGNVMEYLKGLHERRQLKF